MEYIIKNCPALSMKSDDKAVIAGSERDVPAR